MNEVEKMINAVMEMAATGTDKEKAMSVELLSDPAKMAKFYRIVKSL